MPASLVVMPAASAAAADADVDDKSKTTHRLARLFHRPKAPPRSPENLWG